jgi:Protein of unknown function (DUF2852)
MGVRPCDDAKELNPASRLPISLPTPNAQTGEGAVDDTELRMSCNRYSHTSSWASHGRASWEPLELLAMVLAFIFFWPLGIAILLMKRWQRKSDYSGDLFGYIRERAAEARRSFGFAGTGDEPSASSTARGWRSPDFMRTTGNTAFDAWREAELARLEEERRKLAQAERDFAEHIDQLRRARDREEFDSFMQARKGGAGSEGAPSQS